MRYLIGLISIIGVATGIWMLQPADGTADTADQARKPVIRISEIPLSVASPVHVDVAPSQQESAKSSPDHVRVESKSVHFIPPEDASAGS